MARSSGRKITSGRCRGAVLRTKNNAANQLGLPLPSGRVAVFSRRQGAQLLQHESDIRDLAVDEEVEIDLGESADVQVVAGKETRSIDPKGAHTLPLLPGVALRSEKIEDFTRVEVSNARADVIDFELRLRLAEGGRVVRADHALGTKNGRPIFRFHVPANRQRDAAIPNCPYRRHAASLGAAIPRLPSPPQLLLPMAYT